MIIVLNLWLFQRNFEETELDLSEFICKEVNISFAVISEHGVSDFSPSRSFCIEGKLINQLIYVLINMFANPVRLHL